MQILRILQNLSPYAHLLQPPKHRPQAEGEVLLRPIFAAILSFAASVASAAPDFGTKKDVVSAPSASVPGIGMMPLFQMLIALGIVFLLIKFGLPKIMGGLGKRINFKNGSGIEIEDSASFAGGQLYVVNVRNKTLLLSSCQAGVACLADLTERTGDSQRGTGEWKAFFPALDRSALTETKNCGPKARESGAEPFKDSTSRGTERACAEAPLFMDYLDKESKHPSHVFLDADGEPTAFTRTALSDDEIREAIERLKRLGG